MTLGLPWMDRAHPHASSFGSHTAPIVIQDTQPGGSEQGLHSGAIRSFAAGQLDCPRLTVGQRVPATPSTSTHQHYSTTIGPVIAEQPSLQIPQYQMYRNENPIHHAPLEYSSDPNRSICPSEPNTHPQHSGYDRGPWVSSSGSSQSLGVVNPFPPSQRCTCHDLSLAQNPMVIAGLSTSSEAPPETRLSVGFTSSPAWNPDWDEAMIEREQTRLVVWSS
jgi:hypothetical protein